MWSTYPSPSRITKVELNHGGISRWRSVRVRLQHPSPEGTDPSLCHVGNRQARGSSEWHPGPLPVRPCPLPLWLVDVQRPFFPSSPLPGPLAPRPVGPVDRVPRTFVVGSRVHMVRCSGASLLHPLPRPPAVLTPGLCVSPGSQDRPFRLRRRGAGRCHVYVSPTRQPSVSHPLPGRSRPTLSPGSSPTCTSLHRVGGPRTPGAS